MRSDYGYNYYLMDGEEENNDERERAMDWLDERFMYRGLMIGLGVIAICGAIGTVTTIVWGAMETDLMMMLGGLLAAGVTAACALGSLYFAQRVTGDERVFDNSIEREVLTRRQRSELRAARGGLVMQRSLYAIEEERDNMIHRQIEGSDPDPERARRMG